ncbi:MAG: hypothetical protein KIT58_20630, partial [Planctomycetota bacterium]|nr:hypothetical protein [Planctomycetota bacterium]
MSRVEEGLYLHPRTRVYYVRFQHQNRVYNRSTKCTDMVAARSVAATIRADVERRESGLPTYATTEATPPTELKERFLGEKRRLKKDAGHIRTLDHRVSVFLQGARGLREITPERIREVLAHL